MTTQLSRQEFLQNLRDSRLFSIEELEKNLSALTPSPADEDAVAQRLIADGRLTPYQAAAVRERRFAELVIGNYEVMDRLGAGGMGTVYKARHRRMKRVVALKVLSKSAGQSDKFVQRFQREVEAVSRLNHPNIVMAHDADEADVGHFLVMEFVNGPDLATVVQQRGPLPIREAIDCIVQAAQALEYAHGQGIIHRDIKPANLLRDASGAVKVADLGLARFNDQFGRPSEDRSALTQAGTIMGTVDFMPPEQALGLTDIDHRADVYSLGCTLHYLLIGRPPYEGSSLMATLLKHREAPIPSLAEARPDVPIELDAVFHLMAAKAPADRFQTMTEVLAAMQSVEAALGEDIATPSTGFVLDLDTSTLGVSAGDWESQQTTLGASGGTMPQTIDVAPPATQQGFSPKVLLVEPSRTQSSIIRKYLQAQGVQHVVAVASGQEALQAARSEPPDAIVSALHLSDMTGRELADRLRQLPGLELPGFVLISSDADSSQAGTLSTYGKGVVLHKPFTPEQLVEALKLVSDPSRLEKPASGKPAERGKLRVLIVDDSASARRHMRNVLEKLGLAQFVEAADGTQAVAAAAQAAFDLIFTDYNMPYMDGLGLVGYLKRNPSTASVPIIMVTTETDPDKLDAVRKLGVAAICGKNFEPETVRKLIDQFVRMP